MIGGIVRIEALRAFTALIELQIPELAGRTCAGQATASELEEYPNLSIEPGRWLFDYEQARQVATLPGNVAVYEVGNHEAPCVVSIVTTTLGERMQLEAKVIDLFLGSEHPLTGMPLPGSLVFLISSCPQLSRWSCAFDLDSDEWNEVGAFDRRYESRLMVSATIPALTVKRPVYTIDKLVLGVAPLPAPNASNPNVPAVELVTINSDGSISPVSA